MNADCTKCGKKYEVDDEKVRGVKFKFQCHECNAFVQGMGPKIFDDSMQVEANSFSGDQAVEMDHGGHMGGAGVHWKNSIQAKLSAILIMVTVGILVAYTVFNFYSTQKRMTAELIHLAEITAFRLSKSLIVPLWEVDDEQVLENIKSEMLEKRIFSIVVKDNDLKTFFQGMPLYRRSAAKPWPSLQSNTAHGETYRRQRDRHRFLPWNTDADHHQSGHQFSGSRL